MGHPVVTILMHAETSEVLSVQDSAAVARKFMEVVNSIQFNLIALSKV